MDVYLQQHKPTLSIAQHLTNGVKHNGEQSIGFELEHFVVEKGSLAAVPYSVAPASSAPSVEKVLNLIKDYYEEAVYEEDESGTPRLFGLVRPYAAITLEPGAQIEISIGPAHAIEEIERIYQQFRSEIDPALEHLGLELLELGYHPTSKARELQLLPKQRYYFMDEYFSKTGNHGVCMMRATASTQVSIDYKSEADAIAKLRVANALGPLLAFVTDNSPVFEAELVNALQTQESAVEGNGKKDSKSTKLTEQQALTPQSAQNAQRAAPACMARMVCWDDTDPARTQVVKGSFDEDFSFGRYAEVLVSAPGVFLPRTTPGNEAQYLGFTSFKSALPNTFLDEECVVHILSLFFFDARFKTYLELRQADSMPLTFALAYVALITGIFYNPQALAYYTERFCCLDPVSVATAKTALRAQGYEAEVYGRAASTWLEEMLVFAKEGLSTEDAHYLKPLAELIESRQTLLSCASELISARSTHLQKAQN